MKYMYGVRTPGSGVTAVYRLKKYAMRNALHSYHCTVEVVRFEENALKGLHYCLSRYLPYGKFARIYGYNLRNKGEVLKTYEL